MQPQHLLKRFPRQLEGQIKLPHNTCPIDIVTFGKREIYIFQNILEI